MIELRSLTKRYGDKTAVNNLSFSIRPGLVTGFLGPNGAGKSTTMRMMVGLDRPDSGQVLLDGHDYSGERAPMVKVGALLDAKYAYPGRNGRDHLLALAASNHIPASRVREVIELAGLETAAGRKIGTYSLGMSQRLGIAAALLGDPEIVIMDEPINGLDPEGVIWIRKLVRRFADEGRTVFISSHLMSEMAQVADQLVIIGRGRLIADQPVSQILAETSEQIVEVRSPQVDQIAAALAANGVSSKRIGPQELRVNGYNSHDLGIMAAQHSWVIYQLTDVVNSLENAYFELTENAVEYRAPSPESDHEPALRGQLR
jgi:ABC-2 type transport system ATP-binding protein